MRYVWVRLPQSPPTFLRPGRLLPAGMCCVLSVSAHSYVGTIQYHGSGECGVCPKQNVPYGMVYSKIGYGPIIDPGSTTT